MTTAPLDSTLVRARIRDAKDDTDKLKAILSEVSTQLTLQASQGDTRDELSSVHGLDAGDVFYFLLKQPLALGVALTQWLSATGPATKIGKELVNFLTVQFLLPTSYPTMDVSGVPVAELRLTAYRLCALVTSPSVTFCYCLAILESNQPAEAKCACTKLPLAQLASDTPDSTWKVLEHHFSDAPRASKAPQVLRSLRDELAIKRQTSASLPHLNEFNLTRDQREIFTAYRRHVSREITSKAESESIFSMIATRRKFKYATRVIFEIAQVPQSGTEQAIQMQELQGWMEIPVSEHLDPQMARWQRTGFWKGNDA